MLTVELKCTEINIVQRMIEITKKHFDELPTEMQNELSELIEGV